MLLLFIGPYFSQTTGCELKQASQSLSVTSSSQWSDLLVKVHLFQILFMNLFLRFLTARHSPECPAMGMGQCPICKLKWDLSRTSVTACRIDKSTFSAPFGISYVKTEILKRIFPKKPIQPPNGVLPICKLLFPNRRTVMGFAEHFGHSIILKDCEDF